MPNPKGGRNSCATCNHPERKEIDRLLASHAVSLRPLGKRFGISSSSLQSHRANHLAKAEFAGLRKAAAAAHPTRSALDRIEDGLVALEEVMENAQKDKNTNQWLLAYKERLRTLELVGKARGELKDGMTMNVNLWQSVEWGQVRSAVFEVLSEYPELRAMLAKRLIALEGERPALTAAPA